MTTSTAKSLFPARLLSGGRLLRGENLRWAGLVATVVFLAGCEQHEEVSTYTVPTQESLQTPEFLKATAARKPRPARMLAAIVPQGQALWFFKLQGPPEPVATLEPDFRTLLKSVRFADTGKAEWTLPPNWQEKPVKPGEMRSATLVAPGDPPLEVTVTTLPAGGDLTAGLLANINRWRNQLDLPFIEAEDLPLRTEKIESEKFSITFLNIVGKAKPNSGMPGAMPPMAAAGNGPDRETLVEEAHGAGPARKTAPAEEPEKIKYEKPAEWIQVRPRMFTIAAFEVVDGKKRVSITLSTAGGSKVDNVNRWRGQLGLAPQTGDEINKSLQKFDVGVRAGQLVELKGEEQAMLGLMIDGDEQTVFVKLTGDPELAVKERKRFEAFAKSLKF